MAKVLSVSSFTFLALVSIGLSCQNPLTSFLMKRSTRAVTNQVEELILSFDYKLTEELADEINGMSTSEKQEFIQDLRKMNQAAEAEYKSLKGAKKSLSQQQLVETVANKIGQDFKTKSWFKHLQSFAGDKITRLINESTGN